MVEPTHLKNTSQIGSFPQVGVKIKYVWNHHLVIITLPEVERTTVEEIFSRISTQLIESWKVLNWTDVSPTPQTHGTYTAILAIAG